MIIENTMRNIEKTYHYRKNFDKCLAIGELEPKIDGAVIQSNSSVSIQEADKLFKEFVMKETNFTEEDYLKIIGSVKKISTFDFLSNSYLSNISLNEIIGKDGLKLNQIFYKQNEFVILDEPTQDEELLRHYQFGMFDAPAFSYSLSKNDMVWMSINPMEINTAKTAINHAHGNVLVLGGGLGYYPYMISLKDNVDKIVIIEKDSSIIELLETFIFPQFPNKKVSIIQADGFEYLNHPGEDINKEFDFVYIDTWPDNVIGLEEYKKYVKYESKYPNLKFDYWLENSLLDSVIINIYQYISAKLGTTETQNLYEMMIPDIWEKLEKQTDRISRPDQIKYYLTRNYAKNILKM